MSVLVTTILEFPNLVISHYVRRCIIGDGNSVVKQEINK